MKFYRPPGFISIPLWSWRLSPVQLGSRKALLSANVQSRVVMSSSTKTAVPTWTELAEQIPGSALMPDYKNGPPRVTPSSELTSLRLFGKSEADVEVVLYRDSAYWCPYCERVTLQLELARIPYRIKKINMRCYGPKPDWYLKMVPSGLLPAVELGGKLLTESLDIMFQIDQTFPAHSTIPSTDNNKMQAFHRHVRLERALAGAWFQILRGPRNLASKSEFAFNQMLDLVDKTLFEFEGPFFLGSEITFIDCLFAPFMERIDSSVRYWNGIRIRDRSRIDEWFKAMEKWEPYARLRSDDLSHVLALPPQIGPCGFSGERSDVSLRIDRYRGLGVLNDGSEGEEDRLEACGALTRNHDAVLKDAVKGAGIKDTESKKKEAIDFGFRAVTEVLRNPDRLEELEDLVLHNIEEQERDIVASAARYERQRCCTPRDMSVAASIQFFGGMNWLIQVLKRNV